jgi:predicted RNA-binding Zn ribbon-like protein
MAETKKFPLISGHLSLDLVNTEVIRRGQRYDLLISEKDLADWIKIMKETNSIIDDELISKSEDRLDKILHSLRELRSFLRSDFERIADGYQISDEWVSSLERMIRKAPFSYKLTPNKLLPSPIGQPEDAFVSLIAYDVLNLLDKKRLHYLKRCTNPDCVLLFIDESGRRKWCAMEICGNRKKVARHQQRKRKGNSKEK